MFLTFQMINLFFKEDFLHFKETGKSVTGLEYFAWEQGPVPKALYYELDEMKPDLKAVISIIQSGQLQKISPKEKTISPNYPKENNQN